LFSFKSENKEKYNHKHEDVYFERQKSKMDYKKEIYSNYKEEKH
jgi:hypothetical protein